MSDGRCISGQGDLRNPTSPSIAALIAGPGGQGRVKSRARSRRRTTARERQRAGLFAVLPMVQAPNFRLRRALAAYPAAPSRSPSNSAVASSFELKAIRSTFCYSRGRPNTPMAKLLIVDDEKNIRFSLTQFFDSLGYQVAEAEDGARASALLAESRFRSGADRFPHGPDGWAATSSRGAADSAGQPRHPDDGLCHRRECSRRDSSRRHDYVSKPFSLEQIQLIVERAIKVQRAASAKIAPCARRVDDVPLLVSRSPAMEHLLESALQAALSKAPVLLLGESGTGKNVIARQIHQWSPRRDRPFIEVNCTTLADHLLESELFGHVRGVVRRRGQGPAGTARGGGWGHAFSWMKSRTYPALCRASFCAFMAEQSFQPLGGDRTDSASTPGSSRLPVMTWKRRSRRNIFARISSIASMSSRCEYRPCASGAKISCRWRSGC